MQRGDYSWSFYMQFKCLVLHWNTPESCFTLSFHKNLSVLSSLCIDLCSSRTSWQLNGLLLPAPHTVHIPGCCFERYFHLLLTSNLILICNRKSWSKSYQGKTTPVSVQCPVAMGTEKSWGLHNYQSLEYFWISSGFHHMSTCMNTQLQSHM